MRLAPVLVLVLVLGIAACGDDPSLRVDVDHPGPMATTVISVYESDTIDCEQVEFGDLDQDQLAAVLVAEQTLDDKGAVIGGDLDGLSRTDRKVIVARGYRADGVLLAAGCTEQGLVEGHATITVTTSLAATVSAVRLDPDGSGTDPYGIGVFATDPDGSVLRGRSVSWRVYGPAGTSALTTQNTVSKGDAIWQPVTSTCTNNNGIAGIHPVPPSLIGGFAMRVRVSWAAQPPPLYTAITEADYSLQPLALPLDTRHACAIKVAGATKRIVCLDRTGTPPTTPVAREFAVSIASGAASLGTPATVALAAMPVGVIAIPNGADREVYAVDRSGSLIPLFGASPVSPTLCPQCANAVDDFLYAPACGGRDTNARLLLRLPSADLAVASDRIKAMPARGGVAIDLALGIDPTGVGVALNNAGCVTTIAPAGGSDTRQLLVLDAVRDAISVTRGYYNCLIGACNRVTLPVPEAGVGFIGGDEPRLVGTFADATGVVLSSWVLLPDPQAPATDLLIERDRLPSAALPHRIATGSFDADSGADLIWDLEGRRGATVQLGYARTVGEQRLVALSTAQRILIDELLVGDITGDNFDDIVIVGRSIATVTGNPISVGIAVIPTHVAPPPKTLPVDAPCP